jgi:hypothetical protein
MTKLRLGVLGMSEGNGHPYSWSAIFNGYDMQYMKDCPFPVIPDYLQKQEFPADFLTEMAEVTHVWTQDRQISEHIAAASKIANVVDSAEDMIGQVDAILLARDDAEKHFEMAMPFIKAGMPVFIDKPFSLSVNEAETMLASQQYEGQIFTCSSLRYAQELWLTDAEKETIGAIVYAEGSIGKKWDTYGIHVLEPMLAQLSNRGHLVSVTPVKSGELQVVVVKWENCLATLRITGSVPSALAIKFYGVKGNIEKQFVDSFACFKASLKSFVEAIKATQVPISRAETMEIVEILEKGQC